MIIYVSFICRMIRFIINNEQVFSEHEQAPTPPKSFSSISEISMTFRSKVLFHTSLEKSLFLAILANFTTSGRVFLTEMVKRHIYGPRLFIWAYNQVSMTFRSKVLARTSSRLETLLFFGYFGQFYNFRSGVFDRNDQKAHLRTKTFYLSL